MFVSEWATLRHLGITFSDLQLLPDLNRAKTVAARKQTAMSEFIPSTVTRPAAAYAMFKSG
jgi:hypothetical protein